MARMADRVLEAKDAQAAFQATMTKEPGRFLGLYGAAGATAERPSLAHARQQTAAR